MPGRRFSCAYPEKSAGLPAVGLLRLADHRLEADGDQVLVDADAGDDPPVLHYAHARPRCG
jgi:hypothetical protein